MSEQFQTALALHQQERLDEAERLYRAVLRADPNHFNTLNNLGMLLAQKNRMDEAIVLTRKAARLDPQNAETLSNLAHMLGRTGQCAQSLAQYAKSLALEPANTRTLARLVREMRLQNRAAEAVPLLEAAVAAKPQDAEIRQILGTLLHGAGRTDDARQAFEDAVRLRPNGHYYRDLAIVTRFTPDDPHLAAMEALLSKGESVDAMERMALHFALGKAYWDIGRHIPAFEHQCKANSIRRARTVYDEPAALDLIARIQSCTSKALLDAKKNLGDPSRRPIFIVGMPRSGSTLIEQILASHPAVIGVGENPALGEKLRAVFGNMDFVEMMQSATADRLRSVGEKYIASMPDADRIADKMLSNFLHVGLIHLVFPQARIIHATRDPVDTCLSIFSQEFPAGAPYLFDLAEVGRYYRAYCGLMAHWRDVLSEGVMLDVRYEDVVGDLEGQARRMIAHLGLEWDAACLSFDRTERPVWTASAVQVRKPIYRTSVRRWRPDAQHLAPLLDALGPCAT